MRYFAIIVIFTATCSLILGCGSGGIPAGSLSGTVTMEGTALTSGTVTLVNQDAGHGASAELDASGNFLIESLPTGSYHVAIQSAAIPSPEEMERGAKPVQLGIPGRYSNPETSDLSVSIEQGENTVELKLQR